MKHFNHLAFALPLIAAGACVDGIEPPAPTPLVEVAGMPFLFGTSAPCTLPTDPGPLLDWPTALVDQAPFYIEAHEVTNRQYGYCVAIGACSLPLSRNVPGVAGDYFGGSAWRDHPVVNVTYEQADRYCRSLGRRLPTEVEWERVAAGPGTSEAEKRAFPFRNGAGGTIASCAGVAVRTPWCDGGSTPATAGISADDRVVEGPDDQPTTEAERTVRDLAGNVAEWVTGPVDADGVCVPVLGAGCECVPCTKGGTCHADRLVPCGACGDRADNGYPRCATSGQARVDAFLLAGTSAANDSRGLARGGSYADPAEAACRASTTDRGRLAGAGDAAIGFRCAVPQSCVNGRDDDGDGRTDAEDLKCRDGSLRGEAL